MVNYGNGKIYELYDKNTNEMIYIGSTTQPLYKRLGEHKKDCKKFDSNIYRYIRENDIDFGIRLLENFACENKDELCKKEGEIQRIHKDRIKNTNIAGRTGKEYYQENIDKIKEYDKKYKQENPDKIKEGSKNYYQENIDRIKENKKKYYQENVDKIKENKNKYYQDNIDKIKENMKKYRQENSQKVVCPICNKEMRKDSINRHTKSIHADN